MNLIAASARISKLADIEQSSRGSRLVIGERSMVDSFVKIKFVGGSGDVIIGNDSFINSGCVIYSGNGVSLGNGVLVAANCTLAATNHEYRDIKRPIREQRFMPSRGGIVIEDDVWIGANVVLLDGTKVRRGAVIAAGSVVMGEVPEGMVAGGSPLRILKSRGSFQGG